jgi:hypothetical protein
MTAARAECPGPNYAQRYPQVPWIAAIENKRLLRTAAIGREFVTMRERAALREGAVR